MNLILLGRLALKCELKKPNFLSPLPPFERGVMEGGEIFGGWVSEICRGISILRLSPSPRLRVCSLNALLRWFCIILLVVMSLGFSPTPAEAHGFQTAYLELREQPSGQIDVLWKTPPTFGGSGDDGYGPAIAIRPVFPKHCTVAITPGAIATSVSRWTLDCGDKGLAQETIAFPGLVKSFVEVLLRLEWADGHSQTTMLPTGQETFVIPEKTTVFAVGQTYLQLGVEHIFSGIDHLLFVLGLVLIVGPSWRLVKTITAFTQAHSVTLGAATLGFVNIPQAPVEAVIALSILFLASELAHSRMGKPGLTEQYPWLVALTFGLLHGFGREP